MGTKRKLPFGYKMESGRIAVDTAESHWVTHLFSRYNMGVSIQELANFMNDTAVRYDPNKPWNKNMVARILADTRYLGESGFPVLVDASVFLNTEEKRKKKAPAVQKTEAQTVLRRKCGFRITPHIEHEVLYLLNCLTKNPASLPYLRDWCAGSAAPCIEGVHGSGPERQESSGAVSAGWTMEQNTAISHRPWTKNLCSRRSWRQSIP